MSNVTLPQFPDIAPTDDWDSVIECVNSYAEAYANERVREVLEEITPFLEKICEVDKQGGCEEIAMDAISHIRDLIPKQ